MKHSRLFQFVLGIVLISGCGQAPSLPTPKATIPQVTPTSLLLIAPSEPLIPSGWETYTSQQCEYTILYPPEIQVTNQNRYSQTFGFKLDNADEGARNFIYVSVIGPEVRNMVETGIYASDVYNYNPVETGILLNMQIGESKSLREGPNVAMGFTYQRQPDTIIGSHTAQTYENAQPWEFPVGTKEIRYYIPLNGCTYMIGGYLDTAGSNQPGVITEDLFQQILGTVQLSP